VTLASPEKLGPGRVSVELFACGEQADESLPPPIPACSRVTGREGEAAGQFTFSGLRPALYGVRWQKTPFEGASWVDLRDGKSRNETLRMDVVEAEGNVTSAGGPAASSCGTQSIRCEDGADGRRYRVVGQSGEYGVASVLRSAPSQTVTLGKGPVLDFEVPATESAFSC
jgi:hypothetical protein